MPTFNTSHNDAFRRLQAIAPNQHWSAFDVTKNLAIEGRATRLVTTIWNYHWHEENGHPVKTAVGLCVDRRDGTYWYKVDKPIAGRSRRTAVAHWNRLQLARRMWLPIVGVLKDYKTNDCALDAVFDCIGVRSSHDETALWLQLSPRGQLDVETDAIDIQQLTAEPHVVLPSLHNSLIFPDEISKDATQLCEGAVAQVTVNRYERSASAREVCIAKYGCKCFVCKFVFEAKYGALGAGFIHVHHLVELSSIGEAYEVDPIKDLRPVCPNCHAMLHRRVPALSINELKAMIKANKGRSNAVCRIDRQTSLRLARPNEMESNF